MLLLVLTTNFSLDILYITQYNAGKDKAMDKNEIIESITLELRRGVIVLAVLSQLSREQYGYSLLKGLSDLGLEVDQGTLYPLLRRLESQGLLESVWKLEEARPRRYYRISAEGKKILPRMKEEWNLIVGVMKKMLV
jgi:PadR family transcriptional regulator, regulatory protein PadR